MKRILTQFTTFIALIAVMIFAGCEWSGGGDSFNTSGGAANINISGFYRGILGGGFAIQRKDGGAVTSFVIQQSGSVVEITDSNGQTYSGSVGSPNILASGGSAVIPAGATVSTFQISWSGTDGTSPTEVNFTGVINIVSTEDITSSSEIRNANDGGSGNDEVQINDSVQIRVFTLSESDTQFQLKGTWIQATGGSSTVEALAPGAGTLSLQNPNFVDDDDVLTIEDGVIPNPIVEGIGDVGAGIRINQGDSITVPVGNDFTQIPLSVSGGTAPYRWSFVNTVGILGNLNRFTGSDVVFTTQLADTGDTAIVTVVDANGSTDSITLSVP